jgi:hypothetical protein
MLGISVRLIGDALVDHPLGISDTDRILLSQVMSLISRKNLHHFSDLNNTQYEKLET